MTSGNLVGPVTQSLGLHRREFGWFTNGDLTSFVTVREPSSAADGSVVLFLSALGIESQGSSASLDALEASLVSSGHVVVRNDPPGTGSAPDDGERGPEWDSLVRSSIDVAAASALRWPGRPLVLLGVQLGVAIAVEVANVLESTGTKNPIASVVAWSPTVNGRKFLRALKMFGAVAKNGPDEPEGAQTERPPTTVHVGGYSFGPQLQEDIARINLSALPSLSVRSVLIIDRDDVPNAGPWIKQLEKSPGVRLKVARVSGTKDARFDDPELGTIPTQVITEIVDWVDAIDGHVEHAGVSGDSSGSLKLCGSVDFVAGDKRIRETIQVVEVAATAVFGGASLLAIITEPLDAEPELRCTAVVITSTGANSSSGPGRLNARLARRLGSTGHRVVRYDRRGVGGSAGPFLSIMNDDPDATRARVSFLAYADEHAHDLACVVRDVLGDSKRELDLIGTCSGATLAYRFALGGKSILRIRNLVTINQILWDSNSIDVTRESPLVDAKVAGKLVRAAKNPLSWPGLLRSDLAVRQNIVRVARHIGVTVSKAVVRDDSPGLPSNVQRLRTSGIALTHIFDSEEVGVQYLRDNAGALLESLRRHGDLETWTIEGAGHTFGPPVAQRWLVERLSALLLPDVVSTSVSPD
jgi:alpha-beta hydrolase superfamily lysophospholipase